MKKQNNHHEDKKQWLGSMSQVDGVYVAEADPARGSTAKKPFRWKMLATIAACLCLVLTGTAVFLFMPLKPKTPDLSEHEKSEYYELIEKMSILYAEDSQYKNRFELYFGEIFVQTSKDDVIEDGVVLDSNTSMDMELTGDPTEENREESLDGATGSQTGDSYEEVTDNQVAGVTEADRFKRSDSHIYYLHEQTLTVYSIAGEASEKVGSYDLNDKDFSYFYSGEWELYLSKDCKTVTVLAPYYSKELQTSCILLLALDVSDPADITVKERISVTGSYLSSRSVDGKLLLVSSYAPDRKKIDFKDETTFVPQIDCGTGPESIPAEDIVCPEELTHSTYTVLTMLDEDTMEVIGSSALLSYSSELYVSRENLFVTRPFTETEKQQNGMTAQISMSEIYCMAYGDDGFTQRGSITVEGSIKDQYSMDEFEGVFRVVTTTQVNQYKEYRSGGSVSVSEWNGSTNANLYCFDMENWKLIASVIAFAPEGETVQSVRFDGNAAYVCTSIELSDPVFFFDLSDLSNITYKDTGTIEGFSSSLVNFGDGYLLGIGRGSSWNDVKIEIYEETEDGVASVCVYEKEYASIAGTYKSYYIDRENRLIGMGMLMYNEGITRYVVLLFDGDRFVELVCTPKEGDPIFQRGVYIDGYYYILGVDGLTVIALGVE